MEIPLVTEKPHVTIKRKYLNRIVLLSIFVQINGETEEQITYREMAQKIVNLASALTDLGVQIGDVVAIASENRLEYFLTSIAVYCCGGISTFYNYANTKSK